MTNCARLAVGALLVGMVAASGGVRAEPEAATNDGASPIEVQAPAPSGAPADAQLPPVEVSQPQTAAEPAAKPKKVPVKKTTQTKKAPAPAPVADSDPTILSPDALEAAGASSEGQVTNAAAGAYSKIQDYVAEGTAFGSKTATPLNEIPQSISVIGKEQMRDQGVQTAQEAVRYVPGVLADGFGLDSRYDYTLIRGVQAAYYIDGLRKNYGYGVNSTTIEPYALDRIEVLRGPSSMLYGQAPTGGIINGTSKLPVDMRYNEIGFDYGSFDFKQIRFDSTGRLTPDGKWLYRLTGLGRDADTYVDFVDNDRLMIQPSLTYRPTSDTSITVLGNVRRDRTGSTQQFLPQIGTLTPNVNGQRVPRDTFVGEPGDHYNTDQESVSMFVDHRFNDDLKLHHSMRYTETSNDYRSTYTAILTPARFAYINQGLGALIPALGGPPLPPGMNVIDGSNSPFLNAGQSEIARALTLQETETKVFNSDTNLTGRFSTGWLDHQMTGGFDFMRFSADQANAPLLIDNLLTTSAVNPILQPFLPLQPAFDIYHPKYRQTNYYLSFESPFLVTPDQVRTYSRPHEVQSDAGLYLQDQIRMGSWIALLGIRQDWLRIEEAGSPDATESATSGRAALMYEFGSGLTPYVSYSTSFNPLPGQPVGDNIYVPFVNTTAARPMTGEQVELGFKYQPKNLPFMLSAAIYQLQEHNQVVQPDILFQAVQGADIKVRGFEVEAVGAVTREIKVIASYSYTDGEWDKYPEVFPFASGISEYLEGKPIDGMPKHLASLWGVYTFHTGALRGLSFGGGVRYIGEAESYAIDVTNQAPLYVKTPSATLFDAMVAYETTDWRWQLTVQNVADDYYLASCTAFRGDCGVGQPRTIITGFTYKF